MVALKMLIRLRPGQYLEQETTYGYRLDWEIERKKIPEIERIHSNYFHSIVQKMSPQRIITDKSIQSPRKSSNERRFCIFILQRQLQIWKSVFAKCHSHEAYWVIVCLLLPFIPGSQAQFCGDQERGSLHVHHLEI